MSKNFLTLLKNYEAEKDHNFFTFGDLKAGRAVYALDDSHAMEVLIANKKVDDITLIDNAKINSAAAKAYCRLSYDKPTREFFLLNSDRSPIATEIEPETLSSLTEVVAEWLTENVTSISGAIIDYVAKGENVYKHFYSIGHNKDFDVDILSRCQMLNVLYGKDTEFAGYPDKTEKAEKGEIRVDVQSVPLKANRKEGSIFFSRGNGKEGSSVFLEKQIEKAGATYIVKQVETKKSEALTENSEICREQFSKAESAAVKFSQLCEQVEKKYNGTDLAHLVSRAVYAKALNFAKADVDGHQKVRYDDRTVKPSAPKKDYSRGGR